MKKIITVIVLVFSSSIFAQIADSAENISPSLIGEKIPTLILENSNGEKVSTDKIFTKKTVLVIYRGGWCPYCNSQLSEMQEIENQIIELGYNVVAISPDAPSFLKQTEDKKELKYQLYSDSEGKFSEALGIAFKKDKPKLDKYSEGKNPGFLPVPTVYVINEKQKIDFLYINPDYSVRLSGKLLLAVLKNL